MRRTVLVLAALCLGGAAHAGSPVRILSSHRACTCMTSIACPPATPNEERRSESADGNRGFISTQASFQQDFMCSVAAEARSEQVSNVEPDSIVGNGSIQITASAADSRARVEARAASTLDVAFSADVPVAYRLQGELFAFGSTAVESVEVVLTSAVDTIVAIRAGCNPDASGSCTSRSPFDRSGVLLPATYRLQAQAIAVQPTPPTTVEQVLSWSGRLWLTPVVAIHASSWSAFKQIYRQ